MSTPTSPRLIANLETLLHDLELELGDRVTALGIARDNLEKATLDYNLSRAAVQAIRAYVQADAQPPGPFPHSTGEGLLWLRDEGVVVVKAHLDAIEAEFSTRCWDARLALKNPREAIRIAIGRMPS